MAQTLKTSFTIRRLPEDAVTYTLVLPCASLKSNGSDGITADSIQVQVNKSAGSTLTAITTFADLIAEGYSVWYTTGTAYTQLTSSTLTLDTSSLSFSNDYLIFALVSGTSEYSADNIIDTKTLYIVYDGTDGDSGSSFQWNLLTGTKDFDGWTTYTTDVVSVNTDDDGFGVAYFAAVDTLAWYNIFSSRIALSLVDGQECTLSVWYKADDPDTINGDSSQRIAVSLNLASSSSGSREIYVSPYTYSGFTGEWQQLTYTFTPSADLFTEGSGDYSDQAYFWVSLYNYSLSAVSFKKVKLEYGDTATEWTPHPDDLYGNDGNDGADGQDGEDAIVADLSNELSAVPCDSEGNVPSTYEYEESVLSVYKGTTDITDSCVVEIYASGITASYGNRVISVSDITEDEASVLIEVSYGTWSTELYYRIKKIYAGADGEDGGIATVYSLVITPSSVIVDADGNYSVDSLEVAVKKVDVDGVTLLTDADDIEAEGLTIKGYSDGVWGAISGYDIGLYLLFLEDNQVIYGLFDSSGNIVDKESVPFITSGKDGESVCLLALTNETEMVACDGLGNVTDIDSIEGTAWTFYEGGTALAVSAYTYEVTAEGCEVEVAAEGTSGQVAVTAMSSDTASVTISVTYGGTEYVRTYTLTKNYGSLSYAIVASPSVLRASADGSLSTETLSYGVRVYDNGTATEYTNLSVLGTPFLSYRLYLYYTLKDDDTYVRMSNNSGTLDLTSIEGITDSGGLTLYLFQGGSYSAGTLVDKEYLEVVQDGTSTGFTITPASLSVNVTWTSSTDSDGNTTFSEDCDGADGTIVVYDKDGNTMTCGSTEDGGFTVKEDDDNCVNCTISAFSASTGAFIVTPEKADNGYYKTSGAASFTITIYYGGETYLFHHNMPFTLEESGKTAIFVTNIDGLYSYYSSVNSSIDTLTTNYSTLSQTAEEIKLEVSELSDDLKQSGIDLDAHSITLYTDNFYVVNSTRDYTTMYIDANGSLVSTQYEQDEDGNIVESGSITFGQYGITLVGGTLEDGYKGMIKIGFDQDGYPVLVGISESGTTVWNLGSNSSSAISMSYFTGLASYIYKDGTYYAFVRLILVVGNNSGSTLTLAATDITATITSPYDSTETLTFNADGDTEISVGGAMHISFSCLISSASSFYDGWTSSPVTFTITYDNVTGQFMVIPEAGTDDSGNYLSVWSDDYLVNGYNSIEV